MANWKAVFGIVAVLACAAVILWSVDTYIRPGYQCGTDSLRAAIQTHEVLVKYMPLIMRLPHNPDPRPEFLRDENGDLTDRWGIVILTDEEIDQDALNAEARIPDSLNGVPVQTLPRKIGKKERLLYPGLDLESGAPHWHVMGDVIQKNFDLIIRYPFYIRHSWFLADFGKDPNNNTALDRKFGIVIYVTEKVDPKTLPPKDRIPDCLQDVPVRIKVTR